MTTFLTSCSSLRLWRPRSLWQRPGNRRARPSSASEGRLASASAGPGHYLPGVVLTNFRRYDGRRELFLRGPLPTGTAGRIGRCCVGEPQVAVRARRAIVILDRFILSLSRHWLFLFNLVFGLYAGLPVLAPLLVTFGQVRLANLIYFVYQHLCHQMPSRCYFIGRFQVAICERDLALYGGACLAGIAFALVRDRVRPLSIPIWIILIGPLVVDGVTQVLGLRLSTWQLRTVTGLLASGATVWLVYPYLEEGFKEIQASAGSQLRKVEAEKRST
ncbi:MAG: hypothetical protein CEE40_03855 [Chloroflexi bacterium B3_Chlor]|nr:MAG: hypothetical protein CEE40_03855 [Chloroflexi bacterium B3_Chlor]